MTCPNRTTRSARATPAGQPPGRCRFQPRAPRVLRAQPRGRSRPPTRFEAAACTDIAPHRSAPGGGAPWTEPGRAIDGDRKELATSGFVLIVDDDPDLLDVTTFVIENEGMPVETARNGEEALALLTAGRLPALVLLDLMMPVMNGWEFLAAVASDPTFERIPIVVMTATEHDAVPGALEVVTKPMDLKELLQLVERYVRGGEGAGA